MLLLAAHLALFGHVSATHLRFGAIDWTVPDSATEPRKVQFHFYQAIRGSLEYAFAKNVGSTDPGEYICSSNNVANCWWFSQWNGDFQYGENGNTAGDRYTYHSYGSTPREDSFTQTRTYSDGSTISAGLQNWWMTERVHVYTYSESQEYTATYSTCCRQKSGVRNVNNNQNFILKTKVQLSEVPNGIVQNPHCSAFPIFDINFGNAARLDLNRLCTTPHDNSLVFSWSSQGDSGLTLNGDNFGNNLVTPQLNVDGNGIMSWNPDKDGLYAVQFGVKDKYENTNVLDIVFNVRNGSGNPYFVEVSNPHTAAGYQPNSTLDIYTPNTQMTQEVSIGQSLQLDVWGYAPDGFLTGMTYVWGYSSSTTASHNCDGTSAYCRLRFSYTPKLGHTSRSLCVTLTSTVGTYVGAPNDPLGELSFCVSINVIERDYIYISGYVRDFRPEDTTYTGIVSALTGTNVFANFVKGELSSSFKPVFFTNSGGGTPIDVNESNFTVWFTDTTYSERKTVSVTLGHISGTAGQPGSVYEGNFNPWYPINCNGWDSSISNCVPESQNNQYFTYEVNTYFTYVNQNPATRITLESTDFLWVFIDGKLVLADTEQSDVQVGTGAGVSYVDLTTNINIIDPSSGQPTQLTLTDGDTYAMTIFFVHRSTSYNPKIKWQVPGGTICDAVSGGNNTFYITDFTTQSGTIFDPLNGQGMVGVTGTELRLTTSQTSRSSSVYYASGGVGQKFHVRDGFETSFTVRIGDCSGSTCTTSSNLAKVNGFSFIVQDDDVEARGGSGAGLGYEGLSKAVAIEFDGNTDASKNDPQINHISFHASDRISSPQLAINAQETTTPKSYTDTAIDMSPGANFTIRIQYLPGQFVTGATTRIGWIYVFYNTEPTPRLEYSVDSSVFNQFSENAYIGFTASTSSTEAVPVYISNWAFKVVQPSATLTTFKGATPTIATAGILNSATVIQAQDSCGSPVATGGDAAKFTVTMLRTTDSLSVGVTIVDNDDGTYTLKFTATIVGTYTVTVRYDNEPINSGSPSFDVVVVPNPNPHPVQSTLTTFPTGYIVGETSSAVFILRDAWGNTITSNLVTSSGSNPVTVSVSPDPTSTNFDNQGFININFDLQSKAYTVNLTSLETRDSGFLIRLQSSGVDITGGTGSPQTIQFIAGDLNHTKSYRDPANPPSTALVAGNSGSFYIIPADKIGNRILTSTTGYTFNYTVNSTVSDTLCTTCSCSWSNADQKYKCDYVRNVVGTYEIEAVLLNSSGATVGVVPDSKFTLTITPSVESSNSIAIPTSGSGSVPVTTKAGVTRTITVQSRDMYNNTRGTINSAAQFTISINGSSGAAVTAIGPSYTTGGQYTFTYTITSIIGFESTCWTVKYGGTDILAGGNVCDTWTNNVAATFTNTSDMAVTIGVVETFPVILQDIYGNNVTDDQTSILAATVAPETSSTIDASVFFNSDTNVHFVNISSTFKGKHILRFFINSILKSETSFFVNPGVVATGFVEKNDGGWQLSRSGDTRHFRVRSKDAYGNFLDGFDTGASPLYLQIRGSSCDQNLNGTYMGNGYYNFTYTNLCGYQAVMNLTMLFRDNQFDFLSFITAQAGQVNGRSIVKNGTDFSQVKAGVEFVFTIVARQDSSPFNERTSLALNQYFTLTVTALSLNFTQQSYAPTSPVANPVNGSAYINVTGLNLAYAGLYRMKISDGLETLESLSADNGYGGPGYLINVGAGNPAALVAGTTNYASFVEESGNDLTTFGILSAVAGVTKTLKVYLRDAYRAPVTDSSVTVFANLTVGSTATVVNGVFDTDHWDIPISTTVKGTHTFQVIFQFGSSSLNCGPSAYTYTVTAASISAKNSTLTVSSANTNAGTSVTFTTCFFDQFGNNAESTAIPARSRLNYTFMGALNTRTFYPDSGTSPQQTGANAHCIAFEWLETVADTYTVNGTLDGSAIGDVLTFVVANSLTIGSSQTTVTGLGVTITAGDTLSFTLKVKDEFNNNYTFSASDQNNFRVLLQPTSGLASSRVLGTSLGGAVYNGFGVWHLTGTGGYTGGTCQTCQTGTISVTFSQGGGDNSNIFTDGQSFQYVITSEQPYNGSFGFSTLYNEAGTLVAGRVSRGIVFSTFDRFGNPATKDTIPTGRITARVFTTDPPCDSGDIDLSSLPYANRTTVDLAWNATQYRYELTITSFEIGIFKIGLLYDGKLVCDTSARYDIVVNSPGYSPQYTIVSEFNTEIEVGQSNSFLINFNDEYNNPASANTTVSILGFENFVVQNATLNSGVWSLRVVGFSTRISFTVTTTGTYTFQILLDGTPVPPSNYRANDKVATVAPTGSPTLTASPATTTPTSRPTPSPIVSSPTVTAMPTAYPSTAPTAAPYASQIITATVGSVASVVATPFQEIRVGQLRSISFQGQDVFGNNVTEDNFNITLTFSSVTTDSTVSATIFNRSMGVAWFQYLFTLEGTYIPRVNVDIGGAPVVSSMALAALTVYPQTCAARIPVGSTPYSCPDGTCVSDYSQCAGQHQDTCSVDQVTCWDGSCASSTFNCSCPSGTTRCPTGACEPADQCPQPESCVGDRLYKCSGIEVCRQSADDCPTLRTCPYGYLACPDGFSCARNYSECLDYTPSACPNGFGTCPDGTCVQSVEQCPTQPTCPLGQYVCPDGSCKGDRSLCGELNGCEGSDTVTFRCQDNTCAVSAEMCPSSPSCPPGFLMCLDRSCARALASCPGGVTGGFTPPVLPTAQPTRNPFVAGGTADPTPFPVVAPTNVPTKYPTRSQQPTREPTANGGTYYPSTEPTRRPTYEPTPFPTPEPTQSVSPTKNPTIKPTSGPTTTGGTQVPTMRPSLHPVTAGPTRSPTLNGYTYSPTSGPTASTLPPTPQALVYTCNPPKVRCPDGSCSNSWINCPSRKTCPSSQPYLCVSGSCVASWTECEADFPVCDGAKSLRCPDGTCALKQEDCPTGVTCPNTHPVLCSDGECVKNSTMCQATPQCGSSTEEIKVLKCPDGSCAYNSFDNCPTINTCPESKPVRCADRSCRATIADCPSPDVLMCPAGTVRCSTGECKATVNLCPTIISCEESKKRCYDGTCRTTCPEDGADGTPEEIPECPEGMIQCPQAAVGISCRASLDDCPTGIICPASAPVRCQDQSCAASSAACPKLLEENYPDSRYLCPDGSYSTSVDSCGTPVTCLDSAPHACWDGTCRVLPQDCPDFVDCGDAFQCPDGSCVSLPWSCNPIVSCSVKTKPVRCPIPPDTNNANNCAASKSECSDPYARSMIDSSASEVSVCPLGLDRCRGKFSGGPFCASSQVCSFGREATFCKQSSGLAFECPSGICVGSSDQCQVDNGCPFNLPHKCSDGSCATSSGACGGSLPTCDAGYVGTAAAMTTDSGFINNLGRDSVTNRRSCADGSCLATFVGNTINYDNCPGYSALTPTGRADGCQNGETRCNDGSCAVGNACAADNDARNMCPSNRPYRCPGGLCALSSKACPSLASYDICTSEETGSNEATFRCYSGDCVIDESMCPLILPCFNGEVRCANGQCKPSAAACPLVNSCPASVPIRCEKTGECAATPEQCLQVPTGTGSTGSNGCPASKPTRCSLGVCSNVTSVADCPETVFVGDEGCATGQSKCWDGSCAANVTVCPTLAGCPWDRPTLCGNGTCIPLGGTCTPGACAGVSCANGLCATSADQCSTSLNCPVTAPIRCSNGECRKYTAAIGAFMAAMDSTIQPSDYCPSSLYCFGSGPVACPAGVCVASAEQCPAVIPCPDSNYPTQCADGTCAESIAACSSKPPSCPPGQPQLCSSGACVSSQTICPTVYGTGCEDPLLPFQCFDGTCTDSYKACMVKRLEIQGVTTSRLDAIELSTEGFGSNAVGLQGLDVTSGCSSNDEYLCSDGSCVSKAFRSQLCPIIPKCTDEKPYRCLDGTCTTGPQACTSDPGCTGDNVQCADGSCRPKGECPRYDGCDVEQYICWAEQSCAKSLEDCVNNTLSYSDIYVRSPYLEQIGVCVGSSCRRDKRSPRVVATISRTQETRVVAVDDTVDGESVVLTVPAGAVVTRGSTTDSVYMYTLSAAESDIRSAYNFVRREFFDRLTEYIPYSRTVISAPFYCWTSTNVDSFRLNVTIEAKIDRTYLHDSGDICLASLDQYGNWRCIYPTIKDRDVS
uniref:PA14 domain-containing protein n=1 Tax=Lotharella globosa TaxID=91324 RepID=A0A7S3YVB0_9EUKA